MSWAKICDTLHSHPKAMAADLEPMGLWALTLSHCAAYLSDGHVTRAAASRIAGSERIERLSARLVSAGLWEPHPSGDGWQVHDYLAFNPPRAHVLAEREAKRQGGRAGAARRWHRDGSTHGSTLGSTQVGSHASPIGVRDAPDPDPDPIQSENKNPPAPPPFGLTPEAPAPVTRVKKTRQPVPGHAEVIAAFVAEYEAVRGRKPEISAKERVAANRLLLQGRRPVAEAVAVVRRAFADKFIRETKPDMAYIASNVNAYIGATPAGRSAGQPRPADGNSAWSIPTEAA